MYIIISVHLTGNDVVDSFRIYYFILLGIMASLSAQAWGFFVGATLPTKVGFTLYELTTNQINNDWSFYISLPFFWDPFWRWCSPFLDSAHAILTSRPFSDGCGTWAISALDSTGRWMPSMGWIDLSWSVRTLRCTVISAAQRFSSSTWWYRTCTCPIV